MMKPVRARYNKIDSLIGGLLRKYKVGGPAVPIDSIAKGEGATIIIKQFNNEISGLLLRTGDHAIIAVEKDQPRARRRFNIAHELGHLLLHPGEELRVDTKFRVNLRSPESSTAEDVEEIESNAFAAALLMPEAFLKKDLHGIVLDIDDAEQVQSLAKRYEVSTQAMTLRLVKLAATRSRPIRRPCTGRSVIPRR
jgi:Zn-dependent peptidase ImmA (M78 family)